MRKFNKENTKGKWIDFPEDKEVKLQIRPFSLFNLTKNPTDNNFDLDQFWAIFNYCVLDWKGFVGEDGETLKCNEENKKMVFDYDQDMLSFVMDESNKLRDRVLPGIEIKNLSTSQPGETPKKEK